MSSLCTALWGVVLVGIYMAMGCYIGQEYLVEITKVLGG